MKNASLLLVSLLLASASFAQQKDSVVTLPEVVITSPRSISKQLNQSFDKKFPDAYQARWSKLNKDYLAKFMQMDVKHQSLFRKNGSLKYDIIYMTESHLPKNIFDLVSRSYDDYNIQHAARVERAGQVFWMVNLEGIRSYVVARIDDNDISEVKRIEKSHTP